MSKYKDSIERIKPCLFIDEDSYPNKLSEYEVKILQRLQAGYTYYLRWPQKGDKEVVDFLKRVFKIEKTQAYIDLKHIKVLLGDIKNAGKEFHRHTVIEMAKDAATMAKRRSIVAPDETIAAANTIIAAGNSIAKYTKLDQSDNEEIPWDQLFPPQLEPTGDLSFLRIKNPANIKDRRKKLFAKYYPDVEDAEEL